MKLSKEYQKSLIDLGSSIISHRKVKPCTHFRYAIVKNDILAEIKLFHHPLAIQKLALFIMEAYLETRDRKEQKPMVIAVNNSQKDVYLTAGVMGRQHTYIRTKNSFGEQFREAAQKIGTNYTHDGFDSSLIEVKSSIFEEFWDELLSITGS
jgi:cell division control protein 45